MARRREWEGGPAAAKSRAVARTVTMATEEGGTHPASSFSRTWKPVLQWPRGGLCLDYRLQRPRLKVSPSPHRPDSICF